MWFDLSQICCLLVVLTRTSAGSSLKEKSFSHKSSGTING